MSCSRYHVLLSQNLDGRLSSARRAALLDHLAECSDCALLDEELRAAQDLALRLPQERVGPSFQQTLWDRVRAGEGTPDAVFNEPVPLGKRIRYAAAGAAAAALFLVALNSIGAPWPTRTERPSETPVARNADRTARAATAQPASEARTLRPVQQFFGEAKPLSSFVVAQEARTALLEGVHELRLRTPRLRAELQSAEPAHFIDELRQQVQELRGATEMLRWMVEGEFIDLPNEFHAELNVAERGIRRLESASSRDDASVALEYLSEIRAENLEQQFKIVCCDTLPRFLEQLRDQCMVNPDIRVVLRIAVPDIEALRLAPGPTNPLEQAWVFTNER